MDSVTKWLVRGASTVIIIAGLLLSLIVPIITLKISHQISNVQESFADLLQVFIQQLIS
tara:strand:- start:831 stop:1007 length:177 start_codon:yes stop_codon:yes gene_type:complete